MRQRTRMVGVVSVALALVASACAFSSEEPLFSVREAATPIRNGAQFSWSEGDGAREARSLVFRRKGRGYTAMRAERDEERPLEALFIPIRETREDDYIVQTRLGDEGVAYAFMWRRGEGYRLVASLGAFGTRQPDVAGLCAPKQYGECAFTSRAALLRFYGDLVLTRFVRGDERPEDFMELMPENEAARASTR